MFNFKKRNIVTSITTFTFLVIAITGIMMFFHVLDQYTTQLHEILGLAFVFIAMFHIFYNIKSLKQYFKKKSFLVSALLVLIISGGFLVNAGTSSEKHPSQIVMDAVFAAPLDEAVAILGKDIQQVNQRLEASGLKLENTNSIKDISSKNGTPPFKIIQIISQS